MRDRGLARRRVVPLRVQILRPVMANRRSATGIVRYGLLSIEKAQLCRTLGVIIWCPISRVDSRR
jgi:hypothetical protein